MLKKYWWVLVAGFLIYKFWDKIAPILGITPKPDTDSNLTAKTDFDNDENDLS